MSLEDICSIETLLRCATASRAETTHHRSFVMSECVTILIVFSCEAFDVVFARDHRALFWTLILMCEHVGLQVLDVSSTGGDGAQALVGIFGS